MKLLIAGGGTGGHLFPGIAVAEEFLARSPLNKVLFVGTERGIEARLLPRLGYPLEYVSASGIKGQSPLTQLRSAALLLFGYAQSRRILKEFRPDLVLGVGGYASAPVVLAARGLQIRRFIHEQNAIPGLTNKMLARIADQVFISIEETRKFFPEKKTLLTGNPLRKEILASVVGGETVPGEKNGRRNLLIFGGSTGAHRINMALLEALPFLVEMQGELTITHQTGSDDLMTVRDAYARARFDAQVFPFIDNMADAYRRADLIICRAGATTIAEVTACGKPCIFIPFPYAADDHQRRNAEALLKIGAGFMILDRELTGERLARMIQELLRDPEQLNQVGQAARLLAHLNAAQVIVDEMVNSEHVCR